MQSEIVKRWYLILLVSILTTVFWEHLSIRLFKPDFRFSYVSLIIQIVFSSCIWASFLSKHFSLKILIQIWCVFCLISLIPSIFYLLTKSPYSPSAFIFGVKLVLYFVGFIILLVYSRKCIRQISNPNKTEMVGEDRILDDSLLH